MHAEAPYTPIEAEASFEEVYTPLGFGSPMNGSSAVSFDGTSNNYLRSQQHVQGLRAVVPGDASTAYNMATVERNQSINAYLMTQARVLMTPLTPENVRFDVGAKDASVATHIKKPALSPSMEPPQRPKSALLHRPATAPEMHEPEVHGYHAVHKEKKHEAKITHRKSNEAAAQQKSVRQVTAERILARSESDSYRSYCTRSVKGLRLSSSPPKPVCIQHPAPDPAPYKPVMRSRTQRRQDERDEEERRKEAAQSRDPIRRNPDGTPCYATVSQHKEKFDKFLEQEKKLVEDYEEHVKRIRQDRASLLVIKGADGTEYKYNERGFKVPVAEYVKPRVRTPPKIEHHGPYFKGEIIHKTRSHVENMRRMIKLRHEQARWDSHCLPWTTFSPIQEAHAGVYAPKNVVPGSAFHRDVLKYGNTHANSSSKFGVGNSGKKYIGAQDSKTFAQGDIDLLPLSYVRSWPEYESLEPNDVTITIEHCHSCHRHQFKTRHNEAKYLDLAREYRQIMIRVCSQFACRLNIIMKPINDHDPLVDWNFHHSLDYSPILNGNPGKSGGDKNSFTRVDVMEKVQFETNTNRCGAFEIQVALKQSSGRAVKHILFSKLFYGAWPCRPDVATLMDSLMSQHMIRLPEELPMDMYADKLADSNISKNILDTREMSDPVFFAGIKKQQAQDAAKSELLQAQKLELDELIAERKSLDADVAAAEKRARNADAKLISVRLQNAESLKNSKLKAHKAAEMQHRAWGAVLDEEAWEAEYTELMLKNADPSLVAEDELEQVLNRENASVDLATASVSVAESKMSALIEKHHIGLHRLELRGREVETVVEREQSAPLLELEHLVIGPLEDAAIEAELAPDAADIKQVGAESPMHADGQAELEAAALQEEMQAKAAAAMQEEMQAKAAAALQEEMQAKAAAALQEEMQAKVAVAIFEAKREVEAAMRLELQSRLAEERTQRDALEADLKALRDKAAHLELQMAEVAAKRHDGENLMETQHKEKVERALNDKLDERKAASTALELKLQKKRSEAVAMEKEKELVEAETQRVAALHEAKLAEQRQLALNAEKALVQAEKLDLIANIDTHTLSVVQHKIMHEDIDAILEVTPDLSLAVLLEKESPALQKMQEIFEHDEDFWDTDSKEGVAEPEATTKEKEEELYGNDDFEMDSHNLSKANSMERLLFDDD